VNGLQAWTRASRVREKVHHFCGKGPQLRIYDLRSTFASNALAAGVSVFELARIMGTSVAMIERSYGTLIEGAVADIARRLGAFEAQHESDEGTLAAPGT
jgi:hypothetical protein